MSDDTAKRLEKALARYLDAQRAYAEAETHRKRAADYKREAEIDLQVAQYKLHVEEEQVARMEIAVKDALDEMAAAQVAAKTKQGPEACA